MGEVQDLPVISYMRSPSQQLATVEDLHLLKKDLLIQVKRLLENASAKPVKKWLKSYEVEKLLDVSPNTLLTLRNSGIIPYSKIGGTIYYDPEDIEKQLLQRKSKSRF
jgi:hypothetical protein